MAFPWLVPRAVLPHRWLNEFGSTGGSNCMTMSISGKSIPRAAKSVVSNTEAGVSENALNVAKKVH